MHMLWIKRSLIFSEKFSSVYKYEKSQKWLVNETQHVSGDISDTILNLSLVVTDVIHCYCENRKLCFSTLFVYTCEHSLWLLFFIFYSYINYYSKEVTVNNFCVSY